MDGEDEGSMGWERKRRLAGIGGEREEAGVSNMSRGRFIASGRVVMRAGQMVGSFRMCWYCASNMEGDTAMALLFSASQPSPFPRAPRRVNNSKHVTALRADLLCC